MRHSAFIPLLLLAAGYSAAEVRPPVPVILISVDTLRADHLGCYGSPKRLTPTIDALAQSGTLFTQISSTMPLTLPSHVALFTSTNPFTTGVEDNGLPLDSNVVTMTEVLRSANYRTAAFIGGFVLDRRFGLSKGFDTYDDSGFDRRGKVAVDPGDLKRPAGEVVGAAKRWIELNANNPFFLFLHLYDLHTPYDVSHLKPLERGESAYDGELQYVDRVLGEFVEFLANRKLTRTALIIFTSDHGEGLDDHFETTHGFFLYQSTLHVPLIIHWPESARSGKPNRIDRPASLIDVAPTLLDETGLPRPAQMRGQSLLTSKNQEQVYSESLYPQRHFGCAALRSLRLGNYKYIDAPQPELYDLTADPSERENIYDSHKSLANGLRQQLVKLQMSTKRVSAPIRVDTTEALRSLGYLGGTSGQKSSRVDPKNRIKDFEDYGSALALASAGKLAEANLKLNGLRAKLPEVVDIRMALGINEQRLNNYAEAADHFKSVLFRDPANAQAHFDLALCDWRLGRNDLAEKELGVALLIQPWYTRAEELLADILIQKKDYASAHNRLLHVLMVDPDSYPAHYNLGVVSELERNWAEAEQHLTAALRIDKKSAEAYNMLGSLFLQRGNLERASYNLQRSIELQPTFALPHYNLGLVLRKQSRYTDAAQEFRAALSADSRFSAARVELERLPVHSSP